MTWESPFFFALEFGDRSTGPSASFCKETYSSATTSKNRGLDTMMRGFQKAIVVVSLLMFNLSKQQQTNTVPFSDALRCAAPSNVCPLGFPRRAWSERSRWAADGMISWHPKRTPILRSFPSKKHLDPLSQNVSQLTARKKIKMAEVTIAVSRMLLSRSFCELLCSILTGIPYAWVLSIP